MLIECKPSAELSAEEILKLIELCNESKEPENNNIDFGTIIRNYTNRNNCYIVLAKSVEDIIGCCFILDMQYSNYINKHNIELKNKITVEYANSRLFTPALVFIHPNYRKLGYGKELKNAYERKAKQLGYTHMIAFLYFNNTIHNFYKHLSDLENNKTDLLDAYGKDICIIPI